MENNVYATMPTENNDAKVCPRPTGRDCRLPKFLTEDDILEGVTIRKYSVDPGPLAREKKLVSMMISDDEYGPIQNRIIHQCRSLFDHIKAMFKITEIDNQAAHAGNQIFIRIYNAITASMYPGKNLNIRPNEIMAVYKMTYTMDPGCRTNINIVRVAKNALDRIGDRCPAFKNCPAMFSPVGDVYILIPTEFNLFDIDAESEFDLTTLMSLLNRLNYVMSADIIAHFDKALGPINAIRSDLIALALTTPFILSILHEINIPLGVKDILSLCPTVNAEDEEDYQLKLGIVTNIMQLFTFGNKLPGELAYRLVFEADILRMLPPYMFGLSDSEDGEDTFEEFEEEDSDEYYPDDEDDLDKATEDAIVKEFEGKE